MKILKKWKKLVKPTNEDLLDVWLLTEKVNTSSPIVAQEYWSKKINEKINKK